MYVTQQEATGGRKTVGENERAGEKAEVREMETNRRESGDAGDGSERERKLGEGMAGGKAQEPSVASQS